MIGSDGSRLLVHLLNRFVGVTHESGGHDAAAFVHDSPPHMFLVGAAPQSLDTAGSSILQKRAGETSSLVRKQPEGVLDFDGNDHVSTVASVHSCRKLPSGICPDGQQLLHCRCRTVAPFTLAIQGDIAVAKHQQLVLW